MKRTAKAHWAGSAKEGYRKRVGSQSRLAFLPIFGSRVERALQILKTNG